MKKLSLQLVIAIILALSFYAFTPLCYGADKGDPPIAYWRFDEGGGNIAYDDSSNNNDGTLEAGGTGTNLYPGQMWTREGKIGGALECDGTDDYVNCGNNASLNPGTGDFSVSMWVKVVEKTSGLSGILTKGYSTAYGVYYTASNDELGLYVQSGGNHNGINISSYYGTWIHVAWTVDNTNDIQRSYLNGVFNNQTTYAVGNVTSAYDLNIGRYASLANQYFDGLVDDVRIYDYVRSDSEILMDYNAGLAAHSGQGTDPNEDSSPTAYWKFNENTGATAYDNSGNYIDAAIINATWTQGKHGPALSYNGTDAYCSVENETDMRVTTFTINCWLKTSASVEQGIWSKYHNHGEWCYRLYMNADGTMTFEIGYDDAWSDTLTSNRRINDGAFHFVSCSYDEENMRIYIDGMQDNYKAQTATIGTGGLDFYIGTNTYNDDILIKYLVENTFNGIIDELKFYDYARSYAQIKYDYNKGKPAAHYKLDEGMGAIAHNEYSSANTGVPPLGWWRMDGGISGSANGQTIVDSSGNGRDGTASYGGNATGMTWDLGKIGPGSLSFDGIDDVVTHPSFALSSTDSWTISMWQYKATGSTTTWQAFIGRNNIGTDGGYWMWHPDLMWYQDYYDPGGGSQYYGYLDSDIDLGDEAPYDEWFQLAITYNGSNSEVNVYINGILKETKTATWSPRPVSQFTFNYIGRGAGRYFEGKLDDVRVYNYVRLAEEIYSDYKNTHGTLFAQAKFGDGKLGKGVEFDGSSDHIDCGSDSNLDYTGAMTIEAWGKKTSGTTGVRVLVARANLTYVLEEYDGAIYATISTGSANWLAVAGVVTDDDWHHYAFTYDGTTQDARIYFDGIMKAQGTKSWSCDNSGEVHIGCRETAAGTYSFVWNGSIDDVRIYDYARTAGEILEDFNLGSVSAYGAETGEKDPWEGNLPIAHWKMDDNTGVLARDSSGNGYDGTLGGDAAGTDIPNWTQGKKGPCLNFDGDDDYVDFGNVSALNFGTGDFTIEAWLKTAEAENYQGVLGKLNSSSWVGYGWQMMAGGNLDFYLNTQHNSVSGQSSLADDTWHHIATVRTGQDAMLYVDGRYVGKLTKSTNSDSVDTAVNFALGLIYSGGGRLNCLLDDVKIYDYARTQAQIAWDYNRGEPVAHWRFDEKASGQAVDTSSGAIKDDSDHDNDGTASSTTWSVYADGKFGSALSFDGNDYVDCGTDPSLTITGDMSLSAWIKKSAATGVTHVIMSKDSDADDYDLPFRLAVVDNDDTFRIMMGGGGTNWTNAILGTITDTDWHHVAVTISGTAITGYIDGKQTGTDTFVGTRQTSTQSFKIGRERTYYANGLIDDARIYNYTRTAEQILQDYNQGLAAKLGD